MDSLYAVVLFAISASVTPGPNNIMVMSAGASVGIRKSLPLLMGICVGFTLMLLLVGLGFGQLFTRFPELHLFIKCAGTLYLLYLAWLIARPTDGMTDSNGARPFGFFKGALFQWVNAKAWVVATGAIAAFTSAGSDPFEQHLVIALTFFIVSFPCVGLWLLCGSLLKRWLANDLARRRFNQVMAALLALSVVPVIREILIPA
ncbi:LysE family translocator [Aeromonas caviae]|uniref:Lysine transporter LysE n=1 Tax=Aeromonas caviae TaxID=648 RepID=A0ABD0BEP5_AERCA|nr:MULTISPECIES: LysE family translocator [Aeromonas]MBL0531024.1 LysE family translocator [Aeromonas caviae]MBL0650878.1 LysE family translocator [Aeromonas caviae]MCY9808905.1 LysE family translocator [Aeromonas caviae]MEA9442362.1 LysE family translocator [Aeromonas caviae]QSO23223.1 LysE family translocator [Aeromonas caviae]